MNRSTRLQMLAFSIVMVGSSVAGAAAQTQWQLNHPRRAQVNDRLGNQNRRINQEVREGELTRSQANQLHHEDHTIRREERTMSRFNNGHVTPAEQRALNQQENSVSRQIGR